MRAATDQPQAPALVEDDDGKLHRVLLLPPFCSGGECWSRPAATNRRRRACWDGRTADGGGMGDVEGEILDRNGIRFGALRVHHAFCTRLGVDRTSILC
jgi:hypothetical protein